MRKQFLKAVVMAAIFFTLLGTMHPAAAGQTTSNVASVNLKMTVGESIVVSASPATVNFAYSPASGGIATADNPITWSTAANLNAGHASLATYFWLGSAAAALSGPQAIPSSEVFFSSNGGAVLPCTAVASPTPTIGVVGAFCGPNMTFTNAPPAGLTNQSGSVVLSLANLGTIAPGSYSGTLNIQAEAF